MNDVKEILNKTYQRIGSTSGDTFYTQALDGEFVICSNGARIKLTTLLSEFQLAGTPTINESVHQTATVVDNIDPEKFFNTVAPVETIREVNSVREGSVEAGVVQNPNQNLGGLKLQEDTPMNFSGGNMMNAENTEGPKTTNRLPEWDMFDRIKKTEDVELNVIVSIKLPKARHIDAINDMYQTKFSAYLAKQYLNNPIEMQNQIREAIEEWMETELNGGKRKKKPTGKVKVTKTPKKKKEKDKIEVELPSGTVTTVVEAGSAAAMFGQQPIVKDVTKLAIISDEEQYQAAKQYFNSIDDKHKDYYRFENMINLWEEEHNGN